MIIGLIGLKGSGKDTLVRLLHERVTEPENIYNAKFAEGLKALLGVYFYVPPDVYEHPRLKEVRSDKLNGYTPREALIKIGSLFRQINKNVWVNFTFDRVDSIQSLNDGNEVIFITDVRFPNEIQKIKDYGGIIVDVRRDDCYVTEKRLLSRLGINWFSRLVMYFLNKSLTYDSEWLYFTNRLKADYYIDNTELEVGYNNLINILRIKNATNRD